MDLIFDWENNSEFWKYSATSGPFSRDEVRQFIMECSDLVQHQQCRYIIISEEKETVGALDLFEYDEQNKSAGIGILIAQASNRRLGFAKSALSKYLSMSESKKMLRMVWCLIHTDNMASQKLFEGCGFVVSGTKLYNGKEALRYIFYL